MKSLLNVILAQNDILSNRSLPQKLEDPLCGNEVNPGWLEIRDRNNKKEVVLVKAKATAGPPQFHDSRKGGSQKVVSVMSAFNFIRYARDVHDEILEFLGESINVS